MKYPTNTHYSAHFTLRELDCHCGCDTPPEVAANLVVLADSLEALRTRLGSTPLHINSGYRCPSYNKRIKGAVQSQHMLGKAADLSGRKANPESIAKAAEFVAAFKHGGIGRYATFTHVDVRTGAARWNGL